MTPLFAEWIRSSDNILFTTGILSENATVLELGCGISGIVSIALAPNIGRFIATDQDYVLKVLKDNIYQNTQDSRQGTNSRTAPSRRGKAVSCKIQAQKIKVMALDWEQSLVSDLPSLLQRDEDSAQAFSKAGADCVIACDCIYNESLLKPFVDTCTSICALRHASTEIAPTVCVIAQQLRSADVFREWLELFHQSFRVWRVNSEHLHAGIGDNSGFVVHVGVLRDVE